MKNIIKFIIIVYKEFWTLNVKFITHNFYNHTLETEVNSFYKQFFLIENDIFNKKEHIYKNNSKLNILFILIYLDLNLWRKK